MERNLQLFFFFVFFFKKKNFFGSIFLVLLVVNDYVDRVVAACTGATLCKITTGHLQCFHPTCRFTSSSLQFISSIPGYLFLRIIFACEWRFLIVQYSAGTLCKLPIWRIIVPPIVIFRSRAPINGILSNAGTSITIHGITSPTLIPSMLFPI